MEMVNLDNNHKCTYDDFMMANFSVQMPNNNTFGRLKADKVSKQLSTKIQRHMWNYRFEIIVDTTGC